ncbi:DUF421 domain-containing protein [Niallia sp. 01092]|uniref:DUF421 domain-containing protein n=1 Tax=unclassified Niallia TaxID=2837522 RepID=UPI003FD518CD
MTIYVEVAIKLTIGFFCLIILMNLSGKGNLAPMTAADQIQNYVLGGIVGGIIYSPAITIMQFLIVLLIWGFLVYIIRILRLKNRFVKQFIDGERIVVVQDGVLLIDNFKKAKLSTKTFHTMLRLKDIHYIGSLKKAQIEQNGQLTVIHMDDEDYSYMLISDGDIHQEGLEDIGKDEKWLHTMLEEKGYKIEDVFFAEYYKNDLKLYTY